ncbi:hypothetical protein CLAFUW4_03001 [Fulvia fulva]|uniref:Carboxymuconolactone decarboxylase-like domain-containing protein n=1 Tax=Passalora fulva TaxID=5499 RepID=A0A9Q8LAY0_PASFU|nr:uncharacterized protein CLAFUR5_02986 [Fulvia fulva]KAK4631237.1 hypothetical protein CLAFUR4_02994 [Fulvia fulva]KAK4632689.1 hypothetical protein CLAFUR0_02997 [Fulvia fulva]UJO14092.1 hypothetical protein CLAFUR5_02986 [Fulvia fulva]WPV11225.1 hypothetical protein CLAFUW4_03001 [Fulvia fulva]WPV25592.1 hypothetical protein CLAFUW7_02998 [Fulvia fulva]
MTHQYRYPPIPVSQQSGEYKPYAEQLETMAPKSFGGDGSISSGSAMTYRDANSGLIGPFPTIIASKEVGAAIMNVYKNFSTLEGIPNDVKEVAILTTGAKFDCAYEQYTHRLIAVKQAGLSEEQVQAIGRKQKPNGLSEAANVTYDCTKHLVDTPGPLPQSLYDQWVKVLGSKERVLLCIHYVGIYSYMSILMNAANAPVPEE